MEECCTGAIPALLLDSVCESTGCLSDSKAWSSWFGGREVAGRRHDMMAQEERARREAEAYHAAYVRGRGMRRRGIV